MSEPLWLRNIIAVMAGPVPAIHVFGFAPKDVDARHKAGHDDWGSKANVL
jgi:hypothetical protein